MSVKQTAVSGLLVVDKPQGLTSHDVVKRVRKLSGQRKAGHTGTLDPMATGVLLVCLGQATRLIEYIMAGRKQYRATIRFGITTNTLDADGEIVAQHDASALTESQLRRLLPHFEGEIQQVPPLFSALKQEGRPLYKLARAGKTVKLEPRPVTIHAIEWVGWTPPDLTLIISCSAGAYIRALARDIGQAAQTGAHLIKLTRTANGPWTLDDAVSLEKLEQEAGKQGWRKYLHPIDAAVSHLPKVVLDEPAAARVQHGRQIQIARAEFAPSAFCDKTKENFVRAYSPAGNFLAILQLAEANQNIWQPKKVFQI